MLERQKKRESLTADDSSTPSSSSTATASDPKDRNFNFLPGTTLHSSYVNKSYDQDSRSVFLVPKLLYNILCQSVCTSTKLWGKVFLCWVFLVMISCTNDRQVYNLLGPSACRWCFKRHKYLLLGNVLWIFIVMF